jgi:hypothetical protein
MARPLESPGPISLLEDAAHLLRSASLDTLLCHWIGSAPLALFLLYFWNHVTHPPVPDVACAAESLAAALLLIWMNSWRSVFAGRLHASLSGAPVPRRGAREVWRLVSSQAALAATKPLLLPISFFAVFPFIGTVTFYRTASVLAGRGQLDPLAVIGKARSLSTGDVFQGWLLQALLLLLSLATMLNVAITFVVLPQIVRMLTGYESAFTRGGESFFLNRLFLLFVLAATWLLFDPFVQAVYCVRCFDRESIETGEDLRAGLRRIRATFVKTGTAAALVLALALSALPIRAADNIPARDLQDAIGRTMQAPEYNWRIPPPESAASSTPWIIAATDRAIAAFRSGLKWLGRMLDRLLRWIFGGMGLSPSAGGGAAPAAALHWSVWALIAIAAALVGWVAWRAFTLRHRKSRSAAAPPIAPVHLEDDSLTADRLPETGWLEMAEACLRDGNLRLALRAFYLANLAWLGYEQFLTIHAGKTNREFELDLRRRAPEAPDARALFSANVQAFERVWYGLHDVDEEDALEVRRRAEEMKSLLRARVAA